MKSYQKIYKPQSIQKGKYPKYLLIEGDRIGEACCPTPVYDFVNRYLERRCGICNINSD